MHTVDLLDATEHLPDLIERALQGEAVIITCKWPAAGAGDPAGIAGPGPAAGVSGRAVHGARGFRPDGRKPD